jgi:pimeloyl-ACP methyl ester carboxylesterase
VATLVLLHPIGLDSNCWEGLRLAAAVTPDLPGHGRSRSRPGAPATGLAEVADGIALTIPGVLDVAGVSLGGVVAQHLALRHPARVRSLLLACCSAAVSPEAMLARAAEVEAAGMAGVVETTLARWFTPATLAAAADPAVAYARGRLEADDPAVFAAFWRALARHDTRERLGEITVPVTVLGGWEDLATPVERLLDLARRLPNGRTELLHGPHMLHLERPEEFAAAVGRHLAWAEAQAEGSST